MAACRARPPDETPQRPPSACELLTQGCNLRMTAVTSAECPTTVSFSPETKRLLEIEAGFACARPSCRRTMVSQPDCVHLVSPKGRGCAHRCSHRGRRRFDAGQPHEQRSSAENGIWLCRHDAKRSTTIGCAIPPNYCTAGRVWQGHLLGSKWVTRTRIRHPEIRAALSRRNR